MIMKYKQLVRVIVSAFVLCTCFSVHTEVILDGTVGPKKTILPSMDGSSYDITHDMGSLRGDDNNLNLFHSFQTFNVETGRIAAFTGPDSVRNVISRVTGESISSIEGGIHSDMPNADFYLINPKGIVFGPNATLDVQGSFYAGTADTIKLGNNGDEFSATNTQALLSAEPPTAFGFVDSTVSPIELNNSRLKVTKGNNLTLAGKIEGIPPMLIAADSIHMEGTEIEMSGGRIDIDTKDKQDKSIIPQTLLSAPGGQIYLAGIGEKTNGEVSIEQKDTGSGDITIRNSTIANIYNELAPAVPNIFFHGEKLMIEDRSHIRIASGADENSEINMDVAEVSMMGESEIRIRTETENADVFGIVTIGNQDKFSLELLKIDDSLIGVSAGDNKFNVGKVAINTQKLEMNKATIIGFNDSITGQGGRLRLIAAEEVNLVKSDIIFEASERNELQGIRGGGGDIFIDTPMLISDASRISTSTLGKASGGIIEIRFTPSPNKIERSEIHLTNNSEIEAKTSSSGDAGALAISADDLQIESSTISAETSGKGMGGNIDIKAEKLMDITNNSEITAKTSGNGDAGSLAIETDDLWIQNSRVSAATSGEGTGGDISINAKLVELQNNSEISAKSRDETAQQYPLNLGNAGSITINASTLLYDANSDINTDAQRSNGGDITINTPQLFITDSGLLNANVAAGATKGGDVNINVGSLILRNGSRIQSSTQGSGKGGALRINAGSIMIYGTGLRGKSGLLSTTTSIGAGGEIIVTTPTLVMSDSGQIDTSTQGAGRSGNITLGNVSLLELTDKSSISAMSEAGGAAGRITINASKASGKIRINDSEISTESEKTGAGGSISINNFPVLNMENSAKISADVKEKGLKSALSANIDINVSSLSLTEGSRIQSSTAGAANGGNITIIATAIATADRDTIEIFGVQPSENQCVKKCNSGIFSTSSAINGTGNAGKIIIAAKLSKTDNKHQKISSLSLRDEGQISTTANGKSDSGEIELYVEKLEVNNGIVSAENKQGKTEGGIPANISIEVGTLLLENGGKIESSSSGETTAGNIIIIASAGNDAIKISGKKPSENQCAEECNSGIFSTADGTGNAGTITIAATLPGIDNKAQKVSRLSLSEQGEISTTASGNSDSGQIKLYAETLEVKNGIISAENKQGKTEGSVPANISIEVDTLLLKDGGKIESSTAGANPAGIITINATGLAPTESSETNTDFQNKPYTVKISGSGSEIASTALGNATGSAGTIIISAKGNEDKTPKKSSDPAPVYRLIVEKKGGIHTRASGESKIGKISLHADTLEIYDGTISATRENSDSAEQAEIAIEVGALLLTQGGEIESSTTGSGSAGIIEINIKNFNEANMATNSDKNCGSAGNACTEKTVIKISGDGSKISSTSMNEATGRAGNIKITAAQTITGSLEKAVNPAFKPIYHLVVVENNGQITAESENIGAVDAEAANIILDIDKLKLRKGGKIESSSNGKTTSGNIMIAATESIDISGENSGIVSSATGSGDAGRIAIGRVIKQGGEQYGSDNSTDPEQFELAIDLEESDKQEQEQNYQGEPPEKITLFTLRDKKNAIEVLKAVPVVILEDNGKISTEVTTKGRNGGDILISASTLKLDHAFIRANRRKGSGNPDDKGYIFQAGNILIGTKILDMRGTEISTDAVNATGGNIVIGIREVRPFPENEEEQKEAYPIIDSNISAEVKGGGDGGNVKIIGEPDYLFLDSTDIRAKADEGHGGRIDIDAKVFIQSGDSEVSASSEKGIDGEINKSGIEPDVGGLTLLPATPLDVSKLIKDCVASRSEEEDWSIVQVGDKYPSGSLGDLQTHPIKSNILSGNKLKNTECIHSEATRQR